jgi:23S rRNA pseudouridine955/2504/2580 synthase
LVRVNGKKVKPDARIASGDEIEIATLVFTRRARSTASRSARSFSILFRNEHICIIDKPGDISCQDQELRDFLVVDTESLSFVPAPLHRLDKETTGCLVCSQSIDGARWFSAALKNHTIKKIYLGLALGRLEKSQQWTDTLSVYSVTSVVNPLSYGENTTLIQYEIATGKKHQIRRQSALHGHPLKGDERYGGGPGGFFLHAWRVGFPPDNPLGLPPVVEAPVPGVAL